MSSPLEILKTKHTEVWNGLIQNDLPLEMQNHASLTLSEMTIILNWTKKHYSTMTIFYTDGVSEVWTENSEEAWNEEQKTRYTTEQIIERYYQQKPQ